MPTVLPLHACWAFAFFFVFFLTLVSFERVVVFLNMFLMPSHARRFSWVNRVKPSIIKGSSKFMPLRGGAGWRWGCWVVVVGGVEFSVCLRLVTGAWKSIVFEKTIFVYVRACVSACVSA